MAEETEYLTGLYREGDVVYRSHVFERAGKSRNLDCVHHKLKLGLPRI